MLSGLKVSYDDPDYLAGVVFDRLVYGFHPYGRPDAGHARIDRRASRARICWRSTRRWFGANNAILADRRRRHRRGGVRRRRARVRQLGEGADAVPQAGEPPPPTRRVVVIDRPARCRPRFASATSALPRKHPDYLALDLAIKILGGEGGNRLHRVLRSERGLTYGASADINALKDAGDIVAETDTRSETTGEALRLIVDEICAAAAQRVSAARAGGRAGISDRQFPADHRDAERDCAAGAERRVLRPRPRTSCRRIASASTRSRRRHPAGRAAIPASGPAVDRARRRRVGVRQAAAGRRLRPGRAHPARRSRSRRRRTCAGATPRHGGGRHRAGHVDGLAPVRDRRVATQAAAAADRRGRAGADRRGRSRRRAGSSSCGRSRRSRRPATTVVDGPATADRSRDDDLRFRYPGSFRSDAQTPGGRLVQVFSNGRYWVQDASGVQRGASADAPMRCAANVQRDSIGLLLALLDGGCAAARAGREVDEPQDAGDRGRAAGDGGPVDAGVRSGRRGS